MVMMKADPSAARGPAAARLRAAAARANASGATVADIARTLEVTRATVYAWLQPEAPG